MATEETSADDDGLDWYQHKSKLMESMLDLEHDQVMHAIIPYSVGGALDLYYYPNGRPGTAIATKELCAEPNVGPQNRIYQSYELVMFTRHVLDLDHAKDRSTAFGWAHKKISSVLNCIARYCEDAEVNPGSTGEIPADEPDAENRCLIFDGYDDRSDDIVECFGLMVAIEIYPSELAYAREHGGAELLELLAAEGHYPYSDLDRDPVA